MQRAATALQLPQGEYAACTVSCCRAAGPMCPDIIHKIPEMNHRWQCLSCTSFREQPAVVSISRPLIEQRHSAQLAHTESSQMCPCFICADAYIGMSLESDVVRRTYLLQHFPEFLVKVHDQKASLSFVLEQQQAMKWICCFHCICHQYNITRQVSQQASVGGEMDMLLSLYLSPV